jgi:hypothetical protein
MLALLPDMWNGKQLSLTRANSPQELHYFAKTQQPPPPEHSSMKTKVILSQKVQDKVSTDTVVTIRASSLSGLLP